MVKFAFATILFSLMGTIGYSQCCSPGSPIGGDGNQGVLDKHTAKVMLNYRSSTSDNYYAGDQPTQPKFVKKGSFNFVGLNLAYGLTDKLTVESDLGFFINKTQEYIATDFTLSGKGISDLSLLFKYKVFKNESTQWEITPGFGFKMALGPFQQRQEGVLLPIDVQPANGTFGYVATIFIYKGYVEKSLRFFLNSRVELTPYPVKYAEVIPTKYWIYGNLFTTSLYASYSFNQHLIALIQTRFEHRTKHQYRYEGEEFRVFNSSGGTKLFVVPQLVYAMSEMWNMSVLVDLPVYQYYNETQLANSWAASFIISRKLNFNKPPNPVITQ